MKISLLGYMTSGKSSIGKLLENNGFKNVDLDEYIEEKVGQEIHQIFKEKGELYFRQLERESLQEVLAMEGDWVISLGGGTPCYYDNIDLINRSSVSVYLQVSIKELVRRISQFKSTRPLVKDRSEEELTEFVAKHIFERDPFYRQAAVLLHTDGKTFREIVLEVIHATNKV